MATSKTFIGTETLTGLLYSIFCPLIYSKCTEQLYPGESGMIYMLLFFVALMNFVILFILSVYLNRNGKIGFGWLGIKVLLGIVVFETALKFMLGSSFLYNPMDMNSSELFLFFLSNVSSIIIFYGLNTLVLKWRSRTV